MMGKVELRHVLERALFDYFYVENLDDLSRRFARLGAGFIETAMRAPHQMNHGAQERFEGLEAAVEEIRKNVEVNEELDD